MVGQEDILAGLLASLGDGDERSLRHFLSLACDASRGALFDELGSSTLDAAASLLLGSQVEPDEEGSSSGDWHTVTEADGASFARLEPAAHVSADEQFSDAEEAAAHFTSVETYDSPTTRPSAARRQRRRGAVACARAHAPRPRAPRRARRVNVGGFQDCARRPRPRPPAATAAGGRRVAARAGAQRGAGPPAFHQARGAARRATLSTAPTQPMTPCGAVPSRTTPRRWSAGRSERWPGSRPPPRPTGWPTASSPTGLSTVPRPRHGGVGLSCTLARRATRRPIRTKPRTRPRSRFEGRGGSLLLMTQLEPRTRRHAHWLHQGRAASSRVSGYVPHAGAGPRARCVTGATRCGARPFAFPSSPRGAVGAAAALDACNATGDRRRSRRKLAAIEAPGTSVSCVATAEASFGPRVFSKLAGKPLRVLNLGRESTMAAYFTTAFPTGCAFAMTDPYMQVARYMKTFDNAKHPAATARPTPAARSGGRGVVIGPDTDGRRYGQDRQ